jgi:hypothetical protein
MILRFLLFILGLYFIYKLVFGLIIPVLRVTQKVRQQFNDMQQPVQDQSFTHRADASRPQAENDPRQNKPAKAGDYIDFEEVK